MPVWFGLYSEAAFHPEPLRAAPVRLRAGLLGLLFFLLLGGGSSAWGQDVTPTQTTPKAAKPGQRPGSAPTPPVRNISSDPRDPQGPPPPGVRNTGQSRIPGTSHKAVPDTLAPGNASTDTTGLVKSTRTGDSLQLAAKRKGQIETTINYAAKDSIQFDVPQKTARLYNKASVKYGDTDLKAALITVNYGSNTMQADGKRDTLTNRLNGRPVLKDKGGLYTAGSIAYNFKSKKAKVTEAVTTQGEGYVSASVIKRLPDGDINGLRGRYTTCNLEHPHFYIQAKKMKIIPGDKVVTGPFNLVIGDVPTPLGFLFGFFPMPNKSRGSGVLIPTFGQAADRGYYLTNGGYYFAPNDYIGVRLTGDIYAGNAQSFGGWGATADIQYLKRYTYNGGFNFRFSTRPSSQLVQVDALSTSPQYIRPPAANTFQINWNHSPVPKPGGGRFAASVSAGSNSYNKINSLDARRYLATQLSSSISYAKKIRNSPFSYEVQLNQTQSQGQQAVGRMTFTLPSLAVNVDRQYPYQWFGIKPGGKLGQFYEQFTLSYGLTARNEVTNEVAARSLTNGLPLLGGTTTSTLIPVNFSNVRRLLLNSRSGVQHNVGIGLGSYTLAQHFKLTPSVSYNEVWYGQSLNYSFSPVAQAVRIDTTYGFNSIRSITGSMSLNTAFYGTLVRKGTHKIQAIRHKATPSIGYSISPDYTKRTSVFQRPVLNGLTDAFGVPVTQTVSDQLVFNRYNNFLYGVPGGARQSSLTFGLQNSVEMKVRNAQDSTGQTPFKKVSLIDGLDFSTGYNFALKELQLQPLTVSFRTQIAQKLAFTSNALFEAYQRDSQGRPINKFLFEANPFRLLRLATANFSSTYSFNPTSGKRRSVIPRAVALTNDPALGTVGPPNFYADYIDFDIPWELSLSYSALYSTLSIPRRSGDASRPLLAQNSISGNGSVKLTPNLRLSYNLGYDFISQSVTYPMVTFARDLHCWQITGNWTPFGITKGYSFTIAAKSSLLQDLKLNRNRNAQYQ